MDDSRTASVVPLLRYRNCSLAIDWLARVFAFERHVVIGSDSGDITYAQMTLGAGMIMLGPLDASELDSHLKQPAEVGGASTQTCYIVVEDIEGHYERAKANGADIILDLKAGPFGSRGYSCRDLEGHIWNFGSYDPWQSKRQPTRTAPRAAAAKSERRTFTRELVVLSLCLSALVATFSVVRNELLPPLQRLLDRPWSQSDADSAAADAQNSQATIKELRRSLYEAQSALTAATSDLDRERAARAQAEQAASMSVDEVKAQVRREIETERAERQRSEQQAQTAASDLSQEREAKQAVEREVIVLKTRLDAEIRAREAAEGEAAKVRELLASIEDQTRAANSNAGSTGTTATFDAQVARKPPQLRAPSSAANSKAQRRDRARRNAKASSEPSPLKPARLVPFNHPIDYEGPYMNIF